MKYAEIIDEAPSFRDDVKTSLKAMGSRVGNSVLGGLGSYFGAGYKAKGKVTTRKVADLIMQKWLLFQGASRRPATADIIYQFLSRKGFASLINGDNNLRKIVGVPPGQQPDEPEQAQQPAAAVAHDENVETEIQTLYDTIFATLKRRKQQQQKISQQQGANR